MNHIQNKTLSVTNGVVNKVYGVRMALVVDNDFGREDGGDLGCGFQPIFANGGY